MRCSSIRSGVGARPWGADEELAEADRLFAALDNGGWLEPVAVDDAPLDPGENAYADMGSHGWRYCAIDVPYEHRTLMFGGPFLFAATGIASLVASRRRRREAERLAAPQWRPLGWLRIVVTSRRLLVWHHERWWSVWYSAVTTVRWTADPSAVEIHFASDPPYRLSGEGAASIGVLLSRLASPT
jgi:hypothetical protein